jgi:hypothetical protein
MATDYQNVAGPKQALCRRLDAIGWGAFFIWMGVIMIVKVFPAGTASIGIGVIILGEAVARVVLGVSVSAFWILLGIIFLAAGFGEIFAINFPLLPIAFLVCGVLLILRQTTKMKKNA